MGAIISAIAAAIPEILAAIAEGAAAAGAGIAAAAETAGLVTSEVVEFSALDLTGTFGPIEALSDLGEVELEEYIFGESLAAAWEPTAAEAETAFGSTVEDLDLGGLLGSGTASAVSPQVIEYTLTSTGVSLIGFVSSGLIIGGSVAVILSAIQGRPPKNSAPPIKDIDLVSKSVCLFERKQNVGYCRQMYVRLTSQRKMRIQNRTSRKRSVLPDVQNSGVRRQRRSVLRPKSRSTPRRKVASKAKRMRRKGR